MQKQIEQTLDSREVAEMVGKEHKNLMRDVRSYADELGQLKIEPSDFFKENTYQNSQNKTMPCYDITKKGCEFIAHKLTGIKGTEFTARYINRFHEMESPKMQLPPSEHPGEVANLLKILANRMDKQGIAPYKSAEMVKMVCEQYGIRLPADFVKVPEYEQMTLRELM